MYRCGVSVIYYRGLEVRALHQIMSFITNPHFSVGPGIGAKTGGKSVCLNLMDAVESN